MFTFKAIHNIMLNVPLKVMFNARLVPLVVRDRN